VGERATPGVLRVPESLTQGLRSSPQTRIVLVTGKGGTGKTTVAAATALLIAEHGARALVVSTDAAHSLGDALGCPIGHDPTPITPTLSAQEIDAQQLFDRSWSTVRNYLQELLEWAGADSVRAEELAVVPGLDELLALRTIAGHAVTGWDAVIVDCAPTAETVRLLALPSTLRTYLDRVLPAHRRLARSVAPVLRRATSLPPAPAGVLDAVLELTDELGRLHDTLADPAVASIRLVTTPESMVVSETRRVWSYLGLFGFNVDSLVVNRVVPDGSTDPWLCRLREAQDPQLARIDSLFEGLGRACAPIHPGEVTGIAELRSFGAAIYGRHDPLMWPPARSPAPASRRSAAPAGNVLTLPLPGADGGEVRLARSGAVMFITIGPYRRSLPLPPHLRGRVAVDARVLNGQLEVEFAT
jgi:arsenite/tail-anchored protein-transporting ATPase